MSLDDSAWYESVAGEGKNTQVIDNHEIPRIKRQAGYSMRLSKQ